jgi:rhomboid protease GluP
LVYILLNLHQCQFNIASGSLLSFGSVRTDTSHLFGDLTWRDFSHGQVWRAITATFIHFSLIHLVLNLLGLIQLGRMMEEWYGSKLFLAICVLLGGFGNVFGMIMRQSVDQSRTWLVAHGFARLLPKFLVNGLSPEQAANIPAAGGSTVILGLIGLGLVVGWRSRTRVGLFLRDQMVGFLVFTAAIGIVGMNVIDNYGHAGGAIAGMLLGFVHRKLVHAPVKGISRRLTVLGASVLLLLSLVCQGAQARIDLKRDHELAASRFRTHQTNVCINLFEQLKALSLQMELVAYERLGPYLNSRAPLPAGFFEADLDLTPITELQAVGNSLPPLLPNGPTSPMVARLLDLNQSISQLRLGLDPVATEPEFAEIDQAVQRLATGEISSRELNAFRLSRSLLVKSLKKRLETISLDGDGPARR